MFPEAYRGSMLDPEHCRSFTELPPQKSGTHGQPAAWNSAVAHRVDEPMQIQFFAEFTGSYLVDK